MKVTEDIKARQVFAKNLKKYMDVSNMSRRKLAESIDVSYTTVCAWLSCVTYPEVKNLNALATLFNITRSDLTENLDETSYNINRDLALVPILGKIPAGMPMEAIEDSYTMDYAQIPVNWLRGNKKFFGLKLVGDSMEPEYHDGDIVVFQQTSDFTSGKDCCVRMNGSDATFKRVFVKDDGIVITPLNMNNSSGFTPEKYTWERMKKEPVEIIGIKKRHISDDEEI